MNSTVKAILVHGMGNDKSWWANIILPIENLGIECLALNMPSLQLKDPQHWVHTVMSALEERSPTILFGHSLGAAVVIQVALRHKIDSVILLSMPPFHKDSTFITPEGTDLSLTKLAHIACFFKESCQKASSLENIETIHFVGQNDPFVPLDKVSTLPFPLKIIASADHELNRSSIFLEALPQYLLNSSFGKKYLSQNQGRKK